MQHAKHVLKALHFGPGLNGLSKASYGIFSIEYRFSQFFVRTSKFLVFTVERNTHYVCYVDIESPKLGLLFPVKIIFVFCPFSYLQNFSHSKSKLFCRPPKNNGVQF